ncbi:MAG TPA: hypothetical protein VJV75_12580, partial [Candidatus Polarisedimenticolia bacterium]|nr:hypothetical protein [Candidatus Polarisedimenticolia bacterium]
MIGWIQRVLDPQQRMSEVLFGLIMALTFTGSISAATEGREEIRTALFAALGCNLAWGIVDAVMYLLSIITTRGRGLALTRQLQATTDRAAAHRVIAGALPEVVARLIRPEELEHLRLGVAGMRELPKRARLGKDDYLGALGVFVLVAVSTFPLVVPFMVMRDPVRALRTSHAIGLTLLFGVGWTLGRYSGQGAWRMGLSMVAVGVALVGLTIALG